MSHMHRDEGAAALRQRVRSVRRGVPAAAAFGEGTTEGGAPPRRLGPWQKARGMDPGNIAGERLVAARRCPLAVCSALGEQCYFTTWQCTVGGLDALLVLEGPYMGTASMRKPCIVEGR